MLSPRLRRSQARYGALVESMGPLEYVTATRHAFADVFMWRAPGWVLPLRSLRPLRPLSYTPSSVGLLSAMQSLAGRKKVLFFGSARKLAPTAILYALLRRAGSALRGLGLLVAPLLLRPAPRCSCVVVVIHKASIRYRNRYLPHPRTGEGSRLSHAFRRRKAVGFSGIFYALRAMPSKPTPFASSSTCNVSLCKGLWVPFGHYPRGLYRVFLPFNRYRLRRCSVLRRLRRLEIGIDFVDVIALSAVGRKLPAHGVLT